MITVTLPGPPKGKGRPRFSRKSGVAFTPAATRSYEGALRLAAAEAMKGAPPLEGPLSVRIDAYFQVPESWSKKKRIDALAERLRPTGKPDFDNLAKTVDALNQIVWRDDAQVVDASIRKWYATNPRLSVRVWTAAEADADLEFME